MELLAKNCFGIVLPSGPPSAGIETNATGVCNISMQTIFKKLVHKKCRKIKDSALTLACPYRGSLGMLLSVAGVWPHVHVSAYVHVSVSVCM